MIPTQADIEKLAIIPVDESLEERVTVAMHANASDLWAYRVLTIPIVRYSIEEVDDVKAKLRANSWKCFSTFGSLLCIVRE